MLNNQSLRTLLIASVCAATLGLAACEKKGTGERIGEEVDEAARTLKNGGNETTGDKIDDAGDKAAEAAREAKDAVTR